MVKIEDEKLGASKKFEKKISVQFEILKTKEKSVRKFPVEKIPKRLHLT